MSLSPRNLAVVEVIKQRAARGTARVIFFCLAIFAIISTLVVAGWSVNIIFAAIMGDVPSIMGISAGQDQWIAAGAIVAGMIASSIWDVWSSAKWSKGWREHELIADWSQARQVSGEANPKQRAILSVWALGAPYALAVERVEMMDQCSLARWLSMEKALQAPCSAKSGVFVHKSDASVAPLKSALVSILRVFLRIPLWAIMGLSALASFMTLCGVLCVSMLLAGGVAATKAAREKARTVASSKPKPPLPFKSRIAALVAKSDLEARVSKTLDRLASQAPETLAAAEAKAIEKAAPNSVAHEAKKSMRL